MIILNMIVDEREFMGKETLMDEALETRKEYNTQSLKPAIKFALGRHLLFSDAGVRGRAGFGSLSDAQAFYNSYYWFLVFSKLYQEENGQDVGLDQQSFRLLERMPPGSDWNVLEEITNAIGPT